MPNVNSANVRVSINNVRRELSEKRNRDADTLEAYAMARSADFEMDDDDWNDSNVRIFNRFSRAEH